MAVATTNPPGAQGGAVVNSAAWRTAETPAVNGHGTAAAAAGFRNALAVGRLLSPGMLAEAVTPQCGGPDRVSGEDNEHGLSGSKKRRDLQANPEAAFAVAERPRDPGDRPQLHGPEREQAWRQITAAAPASPPTSARPTANCRLSA